MWEIVNSITEGDGKDSDIELLEQLAQAVKDASLCALGQTAANPVLSTVRYFKDEYLEHIRDKKCSAAICKDLIQYSIIPENCTGCLACIRPCPQVAITGELKQIHILDQEKCIKCGACFEVCNFDAISVE
jgi:NADH-quinone oxidoreductase subunit F